MQQQCRSGIHGGERRPAVALLKAIASVQWPTSLIALYPQLSCQHDPFFPLCLLTFARKNKIRARFFENNYPAIVG